MANVLMLVLAGLWLAAGSLAVRKRIRQTPHRRWLAALETLREWDTVPPARG